MSNLERRLCAVVCLTAGMFLSAGRQLAAEEQPISAAARAAGSLDVVSVAPSLTPPAASSRRPSILIPLYVSFGVMQALDLRSTQLALAGGGREANPLMGNVVGSPVAMTALKVGTTAGIIFLSEKVRKRNRVAAVAMMVTMNSAYAMVVSHNYSLAR